MVKSWMSARTDSAAAYRGDAMECKMNVDPPHSGPASFSQLCLHQLMHPRKKRFRTDSSYDQKQPLVLLLDLGDRGILSNAEDRIVVLEHLSSG